MKYTKARGAKFIELLEQGDWNIKDVCEMVGINKQTFYNWKANTKIDFLDLYEAAEQRRMDSITLKAISGLAKLVDIYEYVETHTEYTPATPTEAQKRDGINPPPKIKLQRNVKKIIMPSKAAIDFALTNLDPKKWKNRQQTDHTNNGDSFNFGSFLMAENTIPDGEEPTSEQPETNDNNNE